jgi:hypothetical protein
MGFMVVMVFLYVQRFGTDKQAAEAAEAASLKAGNAPTKPPKKEKAGMLEGLWIVGKYTYVQGITAVSCIFMVEVTIIDYAMKVRCHQSKCSMPHVHKHNIVQHRPTHDFFVLQGTCETQIHRAVP